MDPGDKYLNPRPVPKPKLPRLATSPGLLQKENSSPGSPASMLSPFLPTPPRSASQPNSAATARKFRLPSKPSTDERSRSISPPRQTSFRSMLRQLTNPRSAGPELESGRGRLGARPEREWAIRDPVSIGRTDVERSHAELPRTDSNASIYSDARPSNINSELQDTATRPLPFPRMLDHAPEEEETFSPSSFYSHRRQRSRSRDPSPLRNSITVSDLGISATRPSNESSNQKYQPLETLEEALSRQSSPMFMPDSLQSIDAAAGSGTADLNEKRLPTLPNSPSSAYEEEMLPDLDQTGDDGKLQERSHFSATTVDRFTKPQISPDLQPGSHFSEFSAVKISPSSTYSSIFNDQATASISGATESSVDPTSPYQLPSMPRTPVLRDSHDGCVLPDIIKTLSDPSSCQNSVPSSPKAEDLDMTGLCINPGGYSLHTGKQSHFRNEYSGFQEYELPMDQHASELTLRKAETRGDYSESQHDSNARDETHTDIQAPPVSGPTMMEQLMDELSYLGDMIQR